MRKILTAGMAALTLAGSLAATATPAAAQSHGNWHGGSHSGGSWHGGGNWHGGNSWHGGGYRGCYYRGGDGVGAANAGGVVGQALGAALSDHGGYYRGYSNGGYYDGGYGYYDEGYAVCSGDRRIWDPYIGRYVIRRYEYAC